MKLLTLENSFRAVLRAYYPKAPHLANMVTQHAMQASFAEPRSPAEQAAHEAMDMLKAAIIDGRVRLHGSLAGQLCGDISPAEITIPGRINAFGNTLHVRQGRTYQDVTCVADDIAALISRMAAAPLGVTKDRPAALSPTEACRALIEAHKDSDRRKKEIESDARAIPGFPPSTFDSMWKAYASSYQKRQGRRSQRVAAD
jgi:hypothetical protein